MATVRNAAGTGSVEYNSWRAMKSRCYRVNDPEFGNYGGRGIEVCERWKDSFKCFVADMGKRPSAKHSLDRIDPNGHYTPDNCRWATPTQQARNMRKNRMVLYRGMEMCVSEAAQVGGVVTSHHALSRLKMGWSVEAAVETPVTKPWKRKLNTTPETVGAQ